MPHLKKISTTLSVASSLLLGACTASQPDDKSGPEPSPNTKAPLLIGEWQTTCITTAAGTSTSTGASSGGSGGISGGEAFIDTVTYNQDGRFKLSTENFSTSNCNANTSSGFNIYEGVYVVGNTSLANDGSSVTNIDYSDASTNTYSIFQIVGSINLYLGNQDKSSTGQDGNSSTTRLDGLGPAFQKK